MAEEKRAVSLLAAATEPDLRNVGLTLMDEDGAAFKIRLDVAMLGAFIGSLLALSRQIDAASGDALMAQPVTLTGCRPATLDDGRPILELTLEGSLRFPLTFPRSAIPVLKRALDVVARLSTADPPAPQRN